MQFNRTNASSQSQATASVDVACRAEQISLPFSKALSPSKLLSSLKNALTASAIAMSVVLAVSPAAYAWQPGKDGAGNITAANTVINTYYTVPGDLAAGATTITLSSSAGLSAGDVLMIYQAQGAAINATDTSAYGSISNLGNAGRYEFVSVVSVSGNTVTIGTLCTSGLRFNYTAAGKIQAVRVPQYTSLTVSGTGSITSTPWAGASGGIVAAFVQNAATIGGAGINVSNQGFRGGQVEQSTSAFDATVVTAFRSASANDGAEKGEGIAGAIADYDGLNGRYGRGAPANGGGGGNGHNAGGGGGSNGNNGVAYTGTGNPNTAAQGTSNAGQTVNCWNQEGAGFANSVSSGGGRGGYSFANANADARTTAPGNAAWGGDQRDNVGGFGGKPLTNDTAGRLFFGGGGGAGDTNNGNGTAGGSGGGLVFLAAASVSGAGGIQANGQTAASTPAGGIDAPGGGGGGGSIIVSGTNSATLNAVGGVGGSQNLNTTESEGPGGGGGGGFIAATGGTQSVAGGANGTTNSPAVDEFIHNGATVGAAGNAVAGPALSALPVCTLSGPAVASISNATAFEGNNLVHTVTLSAATTVSTAYPFTLAGNTATAGTDFTATPTFSDGVTLSGGVLTVPAGVTTFTITYPTLTDAVSDNNETTTVTVGGVSGTGTITDSAGTPFFPGGSCPASGSGSGFYQTRQGITPANTGTVGTALLNFPAGVLASGGTATNVYGALIPVGANGIGVRSTDGYLYGLETASGVPRLVRLGQAGIEVVGDITGGGLPATGFIPTGGAFDSLGRYYFAGQNGAGNIAPSAIYRVDNIPAGAGAVTVSQVYNLSATTVNVGDIAFGPDGNLYGATGSALFQFVLNEATSTATVNQKAITTVGGIGSAFINNDGQFFVYDNGNSALRRVDFSYGPDFVSGTTTTQSPVTINGAPPIPAQGQSTDGASCVNFRADLTVTKTNGVGTLVAGSTTTYTLRVTNNGPTLTSSAVFADVVAAGLNKTAIACSATPGQCVTPPTIAQLESGSFILPTLGVGQFYEITVTATVTATGN
jgi:Domain of unknown function DUF11